MRRGSGTEGSIRAKVKCDNGAVLGCSLRPYILSNCVQVTSPRRMLGECHGGYSVEKNLRGPIEHSLTQNTNNSDGRYL